MFPNYMFPNKHFLISEIHALELTPKWKIIILWPLYFQVLRITFTFFQLESVSNCPHEFLQIHDGDSSAAFQLGRFCGSSPPHELLSSDNALYFHFYSEHLRNERGFTIRWETQQPGRDKHGEKWSNILRILNFLINI